MKNPFRAERGTLTSGRACAVYALAFVLMLFLDAARFSSFLDRVGIDFPPAAVVGQAVKGVAEATGLAAFSGAETRLVAAFNTDKPIGAVEGPSTVAPGTAPQRPVADALADFSREAASPAQLEPPAEEVLVEGPASVPPAAVPEQAIPAAQPETGGLPPVRAETGRKPLVLLVGDSMMMEGFGPVLQRTLRKRPDLEVVREGKYSTGLSRQDYFDWPAQLEKLVEKHNPDMVVICMGPMTHRISSTRTASAIMPTVNRGRRFIEAAPNACLPWLRRKGPRPYGSACPSWARSRIQPASAV